MKTDMIPRLILREGSIGALRPIFQRALGSLLAASLVVTLFGSIAQAQLVHTAECIEIDINNGLMVAHFGYVNKGPDVTAPVVNPINWAVPGGFLGQTIFFPANTFDTWDTATPLNTPITWTLFGVSVTADINTPFCSGGGICPPNCESTKPNGPIGPVAACAAIPTDAVGDFFANIQDLQDPILTMGEVIDNPLVVDPVCPTFCYKAKLACTQVARISRSCLDQERLFEGLVAKAACKAEDNPSSCQNEVNQTLRQDKKDTRKDFKAAKKFCKGEGLEECLARCEGA